MNFFDSLMTPLGKEHCMLFYYIGYFCLALVLLSVIVIIMSLYNKSFKITGLAIYYFIIFVLMYYLYRLQYSICLGAFK